MNKRQLEKMFADEDVRIEFMITGESSVKGESFLHASKNFQSSFRAIRKSTGMQTPLCKSVEDALNSLSNQESINE